jgi:hypothetical protein
VTGVSGWNATSSPKSSSLAQPSLQINDLHTWAVLGTGLETDHCPQGKRFHPIHNQETSMLYAAPGAAGAKIAYKPQYNNFIGGKWVAPVKGQYFDVVTPVSGKVYTQAARSTAEDVELALDAAHAAADKPGARPMPPRAPTSCSRSPTASKPTWNCWPTPKPSTTARRSAKR